MKKSLIIVLATLVFFFTLYVIGTKCLVHEITPQQLTRTAISETFYRIYLFGKQHHKVPRLLDELPVRKGYLNRTLDGWGRGLTMRFNSKNQMVLMSLGKDGVPGGKGEDSDIFQRYWLFKPDGSLWIDDENWIYDARIWE
ncbi:MAG: type II secretion system protein GspG [Candidatus Thiodiazotropha sp. DIVDIV]